jgi:hypothetical protein
MRFPRPKWAKDGPLSATESAIAPRPLTTKAESALRNSSLWTRRRIAGGGVSVGTAKADTGRQGQQADCETSLDLRNRYLPSDIPISGPPGLVLNRPASGPAGWGEACAGIRRKGDSVRRTGHIASDTHTCMQIRGHGEPVSAHTRGQDGARFRIAQVSNSDHRLTRYATGKFRQTTALRATGERSGTGALRAWRGRSRRYAGRSGAPAWSGLAWGWK